MNTWTSLIIVLIFLVCPLAAGGSSRILIVVGPSRHPPGTHEVAAGGRVILNGIVWTAKLDVPPEGVQTSLPDLTVFQSAAIDEAPAKQP